MSPPTHGTTPRMTGFSEYLEATTKIPSANLTDVITYWDVEAKKALAESAAAKPAAKGLQAGIAITARADLAIMRTLNWNPNHILDQMFDKAPAPPDDWSKELSSMVGAKSGPEMLKWWQASQERLLIEAAQAKQATVHSQDGRMTKAVEAFIGESFAACVIAQPATGLNWKDLLQAD